METSEKIQGKTHSLPRDFPMCSDGTVSEKRFLIDADRSDEATTVGT
jgi:hypothetical protein